MKRLISNFASLCVLIFFLALLLATSQEISHEPLNTKFVRKSNHLVIENLDSFDYIHYSLLIHPIDSTANQAYYYWHDFNLKEGELAELPYDKFVLKKFKDKKYSHEELDPNWGSSKISIEVQLNGFDNKKEPRGIFVEIE